jgi:30S ribosomal protein S31
MPISGRLALRDAAAIDAREQHSRYAAQQANEPRLRMGAADAGRRATTRRYNRRPRKRIHRRSRSMGKGDLRTRRGKIYNGSYGKTRPHKQKKKAAETPRSPGPRR